MDFAGLTAAARGSRAKAPSPPLVRLATPCPRLSRSSICTSTPSTRSSTGRAGSTRLVARAAELEMPAVALTDHGSMAGAVQLFKAAARTGVKPISAARSTSPTTRGPRPEEGRAHLTLLAATTAGYPNLIKLSSLGYLEGYYYKPRVDWELLDARRGDHRALGLPVGPRLQGARGRRRGPRAPGARPAGAGLRPRQRLRRAAERRTSTSRRGSSPGSPRWPPTRACHSSPPGDVHYLPRPTRAPTRRCCASSRATRSRTRTTGSSEPTTSIFKSPGEMYALTCAAGDEDMLRRTLEIAERCNVDIELGRSCPAQVRRPRRRDGVRLPASSSARTACASATAPRRPSCAPGSSSS